MAKQSTEVTITKPGAVGAVVPDFMKQYAGQGSEQIATSEVEIPRIKLLQALSPELQEIEGLKQAEFFHTIAEESLGKVVKFVPIFIQQSYILWNPRENGGGILARANDAVHWTPDHGEFTVKINKGTKTTTWKLAKTVAQSGLAEWGSYDPDNPNSMPAATKMFNVVAFLPDHPELSPCVITLQRSQIKVAKKFLGKLKITQAPSYGLVFEMSSVQDQNDAGEKFWNYKMTMAGMVQSAEEFERYRSLYEHFKAEGVHVKDEGLEDDGPSRAGHDTTDGAGDY